FMMMKLMKCKQIFPACSEGNNIKIMKLTSLVLLFFLTSAFHVFAQQQQITGRIAGAEGEPLPGVTVRVKGSTTTTTSDAKGNFSINAVKASDILIFSYLGFQTVEEMVLERKVMNITLEL